MLVECVCGGCLWLSGSTGGGGGGLRVALAVMFVLVGEVWGRG
jgi:hypothetical protein